MNRNWEKIYYIFTALMIWARDKKNSISKLMYYRYNINMKLYIRYIKSKTNIQPITYTDNIKTIAHKIWPAYILTKTFFSDINYLVCNKLYNFILIICFLSKSYKYNDYYFI